MTQTVTAIKDDANKVAAARIKTQKNELEATKEALKKQKEAMETENEEYKAIIKADLSNEYAKKYAQEVQQWFGVLIVSGLLLAVLTSYAINSNIDVLKNVIDDIIGIKNNLLAVGCVGFVDTIKSVIIGILSAVWLLISIIGMIWVRSDDNNKVSIIWTISLGIRWGILLACLIIVKSALAIEITAGLFCIILLLADIMGLLD